MPRRDDIKTILVIGSGPIVIGQACEFDYSGTQACKALREEGYRVVLLNSNPATIMTDPEMADRTYIEPMTVHSVEQIIHKLREAEVLLGQGQTVKDICRKWSITDTTYYRWRQEYVGLKLDQAKWLKD